MACVLSLVQLFVNPWTIARQAPLSMRFSKQEYWSGLPLSSPEDLPDPGIKPLSLASPRKETDRSVLIQLSHRGSPQSSPYTSIIFIHFSNQLFFPWKVFIAETTQGKCHPVPIGLTGTIENCHFILKNSIIILLPWTMLT